MKINPKHRGLSKLRQFHVWRGMVQRCTNPNSHRWRYYGGRGISVCERWLDFYNFWEDMGQLYQVGLTLERIDNNKGYEQSNCRWATKTDQARNRRNNRIIETPIGTVTLAEAAEKSGISRTIIFDRIERGWPPTELFSPPDKNRKKLYGGRRNG